MPLNALMMMMMALIMLMVMTEVAMAGHNNVPYYKKQGIEKFLEEDERMRRHCLSLIESGVEVDDLEPECQTIYYNEEYVRPFNSASSTSATVFTLLGFTLQAFFL